MLSRIISGGQTGADRAALDAALESGFPAGGSCPAGRRAEDGPISDFYPLTEIPGGYRRRTRQNVIDADGTVVFHQGPLSGGTKLTRDYAIAEGKPCKLIDISQVDPPQAAALLLGFIRDSEIRVLNVAGPRSSGCPGIYRFVKQAVALSLQQLRSGAASPGY